MYVYYDTKEANIMKCNCCGCSIDREIAVDRFDERHGSGYYDYFFPNNDFCVDCAEHLYDEEMTRRNASAYDFDPHDPDAY